MPFDNQGSATPADNTSFLTKQLIDLTVGDAPGPFFLFNVDTDEQQPFARGDDPETIARIHDVPCLDTRLPDGRLAGVTSLDVECEDATFIMEGPKGQRLYGFVLETPEPWDDLPEMFAPHLPPFKDGWTVLHIAADQLWTVERLKALIAETAETAETAAAPAPIEPADAIGDAPLGEPLMANDARVIGTPGPNMGATVKRPMTFMLGDMWGQHDRRNTRDGQWLESELPLMSWINGAPATKKAPAWGFSRHPVSPEKKGAAWVFGQSIDCARTAKAMRTMHCIALDIDAGGTIQQAVDRILDLGLFALIYTSHSHGSTSIDLKRDDVVKKLDTTGKLTTEDIQRYLKEHGKERYSDDFIAQVQVIDERRQVKDGLRVICLTPPQQKFRVVFPLMEPVEIIDLADRQDEALTIWASKVTGLAVELLRMHFDTACTDPSRLFYFPKHAEGRPFQSLIIQGEPLRFEDIPEMSKQQYARNRSLAATSNPFALAGDDGRKFDIPTVFSPTSGISLNDWHSRHKARFQLADVLGQLCSLKVRNHGNEGAGRIHLECPFEHNHSTEGGTACMAMNPDASDSEFWTIFCHHDSCQGVHKLEFVRQMLEDGWFGESVLTDGNYNLDPPDDEIDEEIEAESAEQDRRIAEAKAQGMDPPKPPTAGKEAEAQFNKNTSDADLLAFFRKQIRKGLSIADRNRIFEALVKATVFGKADLNKLWKAAERDEAKHRAATEPDDALRPPAANKAGFRALCKYGQAGIDRVNEQSPRLFHYMKELVVIRDDERDVAQIEFLTKEGFAHELNTMVIFEVETDEGRKDIAAPKEVVSHLFSGSYKSYPGLRGVVRTPTFTKGGHLLMAAGYHRLSQLFHAVDEGLGLRPVSPKPTPEEVRQAVHLILEEALADFPLAGLTRSEIMEQALSKEGIAAVTNILSVILLSFMRDLIDGPTPGHLFVKPTPGTGASLLSDVISIIATGRPTPALSLPGGKEETGKTLTSVLSNGQAFVLFDNITNASSVDSTELASALSSPVYQARILGKSQTVEVEVLAIWLFTGNNVTLSSELVRRLVMIDLNAHLANPELRTEFRHKDIRAWAREHRGDLVHAALTIIQNWVAQGMPLAHDTVLASYEDYSRKMGGVLKAADIAGFMGNRDQLREKATSIESDAAQEFVQAWWRRANDVKDTKVGHRMPIKPGTGIGLASILEDEGIALPRNLVTNPRDRTTYERNDVQKWVDNMKDQVFLVTAEDDAPKVSVTIVRDEKKGNLGVTYTIRAA